ncbi:hypothetical protein [Symbiopectobacterium purcellii]|uniref:hypothetical protein n=1 Tax=Symbiopectobacterium purcellii TaxID=2871826 RepID=UPI003F85C3B6
MRRQHSGDHSRFTFWRIASHEQLLQPPRFFSLRGDNYPDMGGKVIFVGGIDCASDISLNISIHQTDAEGHKPLQELLTLPGT